ncbi:MAG: hypothetical protein APF76_09020 [Desulfitibacter sp. BRH_c19]|nr:MAG: hypothetical protein APF76_09020 [Desulfitibacter sp. BRH_c19]
MLTNENIFSVFLLAVCAVAWNSLANVSYLGSFFPKVIIVVLAFFTIIQLVIGIKKPKHIKTFDGDRQIYMFAMLLGMIAYVALMPILGFLLTSMLFMAVFFWFLAEDRSPKSALKTTLLAVVVSTGFYTLFANVFLVPLPKGIFF